MRKSRRRKLIHSARALAPASTVSALSYTAALLFAAYVVVVVLTVYYASLQTSLVANIHEHEGSITNLESTYYEGVAKISSSNPHEEGYVTPTEVRYVSERTSQGLSFAGR